MDKENYIALDLIQKIKSGEKDFSQLKEIAKLVYKKKIINNIKSLTANKDKKVTAVKFDNENAIIVKCNKKDSYDEYVGTALCICEYLFGSKNKFHEYVKNNAKIIEKQKKE